MAKLPETQSKFTMLCNDLVNPSTPYRTRCGPHLVHGTTLFAHVLAISWGGNYAKQTKCINEFRNASNGLDSYAETIGVIGMHIDTELQQHTQSKPTQVDTLMNGATMPIQTARWNTKIDPYIMLAVAAELDDDSEDEYT